MNIGLDLDVRIHIWNTYGTQFKIPMATRTRGKTLCQQTALLPTDVGDQIHCLLRNCQHKHDSIKSPDTKPRNTSQMSHKAELCTVATLQLQVLIFKVMRRPVSTRLPHGPMMAHDFCAASCPLDWMPIHGKARLQVHSERRSVNK